MIFGISCTIQSTPCEHWAAVQNRFLGTNSSVVSN